MALKIDFTGKETIPPWPSATGLEITSDVQQTYAIKNFTKSLWFIIAFLVMCFIIQAVAGEKVLVYFLVLVLFGMLTVNFDKINNLLGGLR